MDTPAKFQLADMLKAALDVGTASDRRDVKYALATLTAAERAILAKLLERSSKKHDPIKCETCHDTGIADSPDGPCVTCGQEIPITCPDCA